jgi:hypothetical protein
MQPFMVVTAVSLGLTCAMASARDEEQIKFSDCPVAVRKTLDSEAKGAKIETLVKEKDEDDQTVYWADAAVGGKTYAIGVLEDGTLTEMNLAVDDDELLFDGCPPAVRTTLRSEAFGEQVGSVTKEMKYGVTIYETVVSHAGKMYQVVVAEDGTLVEKVLVIDDEEVDLSRCPAAVKAAFHQHAKGGTISDITRSAGIGHPTFEAELKIKDKVYLVEVAESGLLISKSLEAAAQ